ncbi:hypothetical protein KVT40_005850 [Elsinoe batatas]|uniref:SNF2 N-terminal domain-containing protein n=1 Tax=Elsinoe batatas TaxID=2601811 RepID=A0A8K0L3S5_9PEZI|nr:hypothetical protein KVT40_005850 [Elsinoe batatas]
MKFWTEIMTSDIYLGLDLPIQHLIVDEAQAAKNPASQLHQAVTDLFFDEVFLVSGTFMANRWYDVYGLISLIPGHPFQDIRNFCTAFACLDNTGTKYSQTPSEAGKRRLIDFLQSIVVCRPGRVLDLDECLVSDYYFLMEAETVQDVVGCTESFYKAINAKENGNRPPRLSDLNRASSKEAAMGWTSRAQLLASHPTLLCKDLRPKRPSTTTSNPAPPPTPRQPRPRTAFRENIYGFRALSIMAEMQQRISERNVRTYNSNYHRLRRNFDRVQRRQDGDEEVSDDEDLDE